MSGPQSRYLEKEITQLSLPRIEPQFLCRPSRSLVTLPTELSLLLLLRIALHIRLHVGTSSVMLGGQVARLANAQILLFRKIQGTRMLARYCLEGRKILNWNSEKPDM
jgi:hypothetical protein